MLNSTPTAHLIDELRRRIESNDGTPPQRAAVRTVVHLGYTYHGGEHWKPPLGPAPFGLLEEKDDEIARLNALVEQDPKTIGHQSKLIEQLRQQLDDAQQTCVTLRRERQEMQAVAMRNASSTDMLKQCEQTLREVRDERDALREKLRCFEIRLDLLARAIKEP